MNPNVRTTTLADLQAQFRAAKVAALCDKFHGARTRSKSEGQPPAFELVVNNWDALELFMSDPVSQEYNPAGPDFNEAIIPEAQAALANHDAATLGECLLLILKAVKRG